MCFSRMFTVSGSGEDDKAMFPVVHRRYFDNPYLTSSETESEKVFICTSIEYLNF